METFTLENRNGLKLKLTDFGGIVMELHTPDRDGKLADITLGFDTVAEYVDHNDAYFGAIIGRYGNRIGKSRFTLDEIEYDCLLSNDGENHIHGGGVGFDKVVWNAEEISGDRYSGVRMSYVSKDGEEGYPGNLEAQVSYLLTDDNEWIIEYEARSDKATVYNPTNHAYFNLAGHEGASPLNQLIRINASHFTATDAGGIPTGEIRPVAGNGLDFRTAKTLGQDIDSDEEAIHSRDGFDHNFVLDKSPEAYSLAAVAWDPESGREMKVYTTEPGLQLYSGNYLDGSLVGKGGFAYPKRGAFCLETQHFPDSPNVGHFPSTCLRPGEVFKSKTVHAFGVR